MSRQQLPTLPDRGASARNCALLRETVARLAVELADGRVTPSRQELEPGGFLDSLTRVLDAHYLHIEADRVRRWVANTR